jgi:hypothetical protein
LGRAWVRDAGVTSRLACRLRGRLPLQLDVELPEQRGELRRVRALRRAHVREGLRERGRRGRRSRLRDPEAQRPRARHTQQGEHPRPQAQDEDSAAPLARPLQLVGRLPRELPLHLLRLRGESLPQGRQALA